MKINPSREGMLGTEKERGRIMSYVNPTSKDVRDMEEAYKINDFDSMRDVFSRFDSGFIGNIFEVYDMDIKTKFAQSFLEKYSTDEVIAKDIKPRVVPDRMKVKKTKKPKKVVKQKARSGKTYRRTKPKSFTKSEIIFFQTRKDKTGSEIYKDYIRVFGEKRTKSSVVSKFYRVRK